MFSREVAKSRLPESPLWKYRKGSKNTLVTALNLPDNRYTRSSDAEKNQGDARMNTRAPLHEGPFEMDLIKNMSHDIRSSLVTITAILKLLRRGRYGEMDEGVAEKVGELYGYAQRLVGIAEDYLNMTVAFSAGMEVERQEVELQAEIIDPVLEELFIDIREQQIATEPQFCNPPGETKVRANATLLKSVYRNLFKNAVRYGGKGCIITYGLEDQGSHWRLNVFNTGKPLPFRFKEQIFQEDYGGSDRGVGIGLAMVRKVIRAHGGEITYEPLMNGSNFVFTLSK